jgi:class 3 adenylate cyclase
MADLEASSPLSRQLSTAQYFAFGRRLVRAADRCVIDAGGIVGRHAGDGIVAFFLTETSGSESAAARACISTARNLRNALADVAARSGLSGLDVSLRFGLHWGATLYMGRILTGGRSEVTALGDEVNDTARIDASATGGRVLASKPLIERLDRADAEVVGLDIGHVDIHAARGTGNGDRQSTTGRTFDRRLRDLTPLRPIYLWRRARQPSHT